MGDRVQVDVTVKKEHITLFLKHFEELKEEPLLDEADQYSSTCAIREEAYDLMFESVDEGGVALMRDAAHAGCVFTAQHGQGGNYGSWIFYSDGKELHSWETGYEGGLVLNDLTASLIGEAMGFERVRMLTKWELGELAPGYAWCETCHGYGLIPEGIASWEVCPTNCGCGDAPEE